MSVGSERSPHVSVIIPTYEEHEAIGAVLAELAQRYPARAFEIVVVDDSPDDRTAAAVRAAPDPHDRIRLIERGGSGLGTAVLHGFDTAHGYDLVVMDGDGQHPAAMAVPFADTLEDADMVFGSRYVTSGSDGEWATSRQLISLGGAAAAWAAVPDARRLQDPMSGMFAVRRSVVEAVRERLKPDGFKIGLEILARAPIDSVAEVPIEFDERLAGESTFDAGEVLRYLRHCGRLAVASRRRPRPARTAEVGHVDA